MEVNNNPNLSQLYQHTERALLVKILAELRVQTLMFAQVNGITDDVSRLRDEVMSLGNTNSTEL